LGPPAVGELRRLGDGRTYLRDAALLPDGKRALAGFGNELVMWDLVTGGVIRRFAGDRFIVERIALSADGRIAVSAGTARGVSVWDVEMGKETQQLKGHSGPIRCLALSSDGRIALTGGGMALLRNGQPVIENGRQIYDDVGVRVWDTATGQELRRFPGHTNVL